MNPLEKTKAVVNDIAHGNAPRGVGSRRENAGGTPTVSIPTNGFSPETSQKTPKTPADEGIEFFEAPIAHGEHPIQVYELKMNPEGSPGKDKSYIRLPPPYVPYVLRFSFDAGTKVSRNGILWTNFPVKGGKFERNTFHPISLSSDISKPIQVDLPILHAGAFAYHVEYDGGDGEPRVTTDKGYFNVDPILRVKKRASILSSDHKPLPALSGGGAIDKSLVKVPLDGLSVLTIVSKWMGPLSKWKPHYQEAMERGYNMLHYTPLQQRGESKSPYSIADQLSYDIELFDPGYEGSSEDGVEEVKKTLKMARDQYGLLALTDIVLNHTANNTEWLIEHPEAGYSPVNTPHLMPAYELDTILLEFSNSLKSKGLPTSVTTAAELETLMSALREELKAHNFWKYYVLDVKREKEAVLAALPTAPEWTGSPVAGKQVTELATLVSSDTVHYNVAEKFHRHFALSVDPEFAASLVKAAFTELKDDNSLSEAWGRVVDVLNVPLYQEWEEDTEAALLQIKNRIKYLRLEEHGPKWGEVTPQLPLIEPYFTRLKTDKYDPLTRALANNGWIWNADPLRNFALRPSKAYLRREVIVWGDCVKLRYGDGPQDNKWLWDHMTAYVQQLAGMFDGFRIDNCHSTPLHVGIHLLDAARVVNPNLYVCAELFTGSEEIDTQFVSQLGINSLIREAYNAWDPKELSRLLYRYGVGKPIGSMDSACLTSKGELKAPTPSGKGPIRPCVVSPLLGSVPHALLFDLTHDNESPLHKRSAEDALSTGALVTFSFSAIGSVKGFDDLYPRLLNLVTEKRKYEVGTESGIGKMKRVLEHLHTEMVLKGYSEGHVHQENDYIVFHRVQPTTQKGYILVAHTAFYKGSKDRGWIKPIMLRRTKVKYICGGSIEIKSYEGGDDPDLLRGLPSTLVEIPHTDIKVTEGSDYDGPYSEIVVPDKFPPGSIMLFKTHLQGVDPDLDTFCSSGAEKAFSELSDVDLNVVLHRAEGEELDATKGDIGAYNVPGMGKLVYCGLEGWMHPLRHIMKYNDLGHPLCGNLRDGCWSMDYVVNRLIKQVDTLPKLAVPAKWFKERFDKVKADIPPFLRPKYFALVISTAYKAARRAAVENMSGFVSDGHNLTQDLALVSIQLHGIVQSASLRPDKPTPSLAAGLPHFAAGWARCWGRDVFISLRGLFLTTGNFEAAKAHILTFASTLKHGLIPNLLDSVRTPRYNSRDSPWWMLQNIQDYVHSAPNGIAILNEKVKRRFPKDDTFVPWDDPKAYAYSSTIAEIIQEILQRHADGIHFREYNAGPNLDMQMRDEGFNIDIDVDWSTGFILGGNRYNCGTWMDKMGESVRAGNKGLPGTPRDGAPVEITGLLASTVHWLDRLSSHKKFPFQGVEATIDGQRRLVTYKEWFELIKANFERYYYIPTDAAEDAEYHLDPKLVNRRGIYKDVYGSGKGREWSDYQLRCNYPIAMVVCPEIFDKQHALIALRRANEILRSPLGMKTLDPLDFQYRPYYDNSNDSDDPSIAKGLNYHNGPEWGWPLGYFLRAYLYFDLAVGEGASDRTLTLHRTHGWLLDVRTHLESDPWRGLPELTNKNGLFCPDSCNTQAWSASTMLDFLEDVHKLTEAAK